MRENSPISELWNLDEGDAERERKVRSIESVSVRYLRNGSWETMPIQLDPEEIPNAEALLARVGRCGMYELIGRTRENKIATRQRVNLAAVGAEEPDNEPRQQAQPQVPPEMQAMAAMGPMGPLLLMMQNQQAQTMQMFLAMNKNQSDLMAAIIPAIAGRQDTLTPTLLEKMLEQRGAGDPQQAFLSGVQTVAELQAGKREADAEAKAAKDQEGSLTQTMGMVLEGLKLFQTFTAQGMPNAAAEAQVISQFGGAVPNG